MAHKFVLHSYSLPTFCDLCSGFLWGFTNQGYQCFYCKYNCHEACQAGIKNVCLPGIHEAESIKYEHVFAVETFATPTYCNLCGNILLGLTSQGQSCQICGMVSHDSCISLFPKNCRPSHSSKRNEHHLVDGNVAEAGDCMACKEAVSSNLLNTMSVSKCSWCDKLVHQQCKPQAAAQDCDFGTYKDYIIPPKCLGWDTAANAFKVVTTTGFPRMPLMVFVNPKSGGQLGQTLITNFRRILGAAQIINLGETGPKPGLELIKQANTIAKDIPFVVMACGGDGTISWVLEAMYQEGLHNYPVGIIPLGTGNDLSRTLGWGKTFYPETFLDTMESIITAKQHKLDRWTVNITPVDPTEKPSSHIMNNYFSVGVDAKVALQFHEERQKNPEMFQSRLGNKLWYTRFGLSAFLDGCQSLDKTISVKVDGYEIDLPDLEGVIVLNITNYAGGVSLWEHDPTMKFVPQQIDDGVLEVLGVTGAGHMGQIQAKLSTAMKLAQGKHIEITFLTVHPIPVQVDGEPWEQSRATITISHVCQANMLVKTVALE